MEGGETRLHLPPQKLIVAMKGHPGSGKSTLARALALALGCPLLDKDDIRDCTWALEQKPQPSVPPSLLNDLSYSVLWRMARTQLDLGLSVVLDSPLSRRAHLDSLLRLAAGARVVVVECRPGDDSVWRRRLERRGREAAGGREDDGVGWHKPRSWEELRRLVEGYQGCTDYELGEVPKIVVDTTTGAEVEETVRIVLKFIRKETSLSVI